MNPTATGADAAGIADGPVPRREPARRPNANLIAPPTLADYCQGHPVGALDGATSTELRELTRQARDWPVLDRHDQRERWVGEARRGLRRILDWLETFPGQGWQERWHASGADERDPVTALAGAARPGAVATHRSTCELNAGLCWLLLNQVVRPDYRLFAARKMPAVFDIFAHLHDPDTFARVGGDRGRPCTIDGVTAVPATLMRARTSLIKMLLHTGKSRLDELTGDDVLELRGWGIASGRPARGLPTAWDVLARLEILPVGSSLRAATRLGRPEPTDLVAYYRLTNTTVAEILTRYLTERAAALDFPSLRSLAADLAGRFWADIEVHHPEMGVAGRGLALPEEIAQAWKRRLIEQPGRGGTPIDDTTRYTILMNVRAFYLDLADWAQTDPSWAGFVAPTPVRRTDIAGFDKARARVTARVHQRIRERLPKLPQLVAVAEDHLRDQQALLAAARQTDTGKTFTHAGRTYRRCPLKWIPQAEAAASRDAVVVLHCLDSDTRVDQTIVEDEAFWAWAVIETFRHTGIRIEELLELTQLALISYRLPSTGEIVPLLQIVPSKSNEERLLLVSPELASVLASIITRLRSMSGTATVPLVSRYDRFERHTGPPLPHLFQTRSNSAMQQVMGYHSVRKLLLATAARAGLTDAAGAPLQFTAHDFRRMFTTDVVNNGLPIHIAARLLGHHSVTTTQAYHAVFQDDLIRTYRGFLDRRRATRPQAEYRQPTNEEWREFEQHFERRKVELGNCGRPYGSPCQHEHACIRCPMLQVDPRQHGRLTEIARNLNDRIAEATANGWLGEVEGLKISLNAAKTKLAALTKTTPAPAPRVTDLGIPVISDNPRTES